MTSEVTLLSSVATEPAPTAWAVQREPYRLFFPLGLLLSWAGVGHWLLIALGGTGANPVFHAMTQVQGFLMCFAVGFLFTMVPRRTETAPPSRAAIVIGAVAPVLTTVAAARQSWAVAQTFALVLALTLIVFLVTRLRASRAHRRPPNSFVWLPVAFAFAIGGMVLAGVGAAGGTARWWLHELGQTWVLQGMFLALVLGVGGLALPLMLHGEKPADGADAPRDVRARAGHLLAAVALAVTFVIEARGLVQLGHGLRGALVLALLAPRLARWPTRPGYNRRLIWAAGWALPAGYLLAAALPDHAKAALHVTFIGGLALLTLAVGAQVTLGHGGYDALLVGRPRAVPIIGALVAVAVAARLVMALWPAQYLAAMGVAAAAFLAATAVWAAFLGPKLLARPH